VAVSGEEWGVVGAGCAGGEHDFCSIAICRGGGCGNLRWGRCKFAAKTWGG
jgi:hypothetical protein